MTHLKQICIRGSLIAFVVASCVLADQLSKKWAIANLLPGQPQPFIPGLIRLNIVNNPGAAFSLGSNNGELMGLLAATFSTLIFFWIVKRTLSKSPLPVVEQLGMGCILGGALGNLIDRVHQGCVTDFLEFAFVSFPVFNVADALIDVGIAFLFITIWTTREEEDETKDAIVARQTDSASPASNDERGSAADAQVSNSAPKTD